MKKFVVVYVQSDYYDTFYGESVEFKYAVRENFHSRIEAEKRCAELQKSTFAEYIDYYEVQI